MTTRREFLVTGAAVAAGATALKPTEAAPAATTERKSEYRDERRLPPGMPGRDYTPVVTPNGVTLPWKIVDGIKVYHLITEEVEHEFAPGLRARCWGFNGRVHGPTIEAVEGDWVRIFVTNKLPAPTSIHWHGVLLPSGMDGVGGLSQKLIKPGETFKYEFRIRQHGTQMYHSHHDEMTQMALGLMGLFVMHPRKPKRRIDRDFALLLSEWRIDPGTHRPDPNEMTDFNIFTINARVFPGTDALVTKLGQRVRIRVANLSPMDHHPIHLHGHQFEIVGTDGGEIPEAAQWPETTTLVPVGSVRDIEFIADNPGDWALHCHMTHHTMNQMGHEIPNMIGANTQGVDKQVRSLLPGYMTMGEAGMSGHAEHIESGHMPVPENSIPMIGAPGPFDYIDMGGMFTILKVREHLASYDDPGWYDHPRGTVASLASAEELRRNGVEIV
jgi:FtsP/CotA-like multicopper oxidase with cupredoxin domain